MIFDSDSSERQESKFAYQSFVVLGWADEVNRLSKI